MVKKITTESGAIYFLDGMRVMRASGEMNPFMTMENVSWLDLDPDPYRMRPVTVGKSAYFFLVGNKLRVTTPVIFIDEVDILETLMYG